jgi:hypothetical protein
VPALPPGNTVAQWNQIAEDVIVGSGTFQGEGFVYMSYTSAAVYNAAVAIRRGFEAYGPPIRNAPRRASVDAAVIEAAYRTLRASLPESSCPTAASDARNTCLCVGPRLDAQYADALARIPPGQAKTDGQAVGLQASNDILARRSGDGRMTPISVSSSFPTLPPGPGVWRLTPPGFLAPQTPWLAHVDPFLLRSSHQFRPGPPLSLDSDEWVEAFDEVKAYGPVSGSLRSPEQTAIALFWSANTVRQFNRVGRDLAADAGLGLEETARLAAMLNLVAADALMSTFDAKYHHLFWRPDTAIDPTAVTADGYGPVPGYDDGNPATAEQVGWRSLLTTPNHPEYPSAHGTLSSAMAEVFSAFLGTNRIDLDIHGFDPMGPPGNLNAVRHFNRTSDLRNEIIDARLWAGLHYRFSIVAGLDLGRDLARYGLRHAFQPVDCETHHSGDHD